MRSAALLFPVLVLSVALVACSARRSEPFRGPLESNDAKVQHGKLLFDRHCHRCHTGGEAALGPAINNKPLPGALIHFQVRYGVGTMPGFSEEELSDEDVGAIAAYLIALRRNDRDS